MQKRVLSEWLGAPIPADWKHREHQVGSVLEKIFKRAGLTERYTQEELGGIWREAVGEFLALHSKPISLTDGVLTVAVLQPSVRFTLEGQLKKQILEKLRDKFKGATLRQIRFSLG